MQKVWKLNKYDENKIKELMKQYNISEMLAKLILSRDIENVDIFLNGTLEDLNDPFKMKDMDKFVKRIKHAIDNNEKICIYGDYDVDGITSITVMYKFLTSLGADVMYYLPDRLIEGYGLNLKALDKIKEDGAKLVITVDCGITAVEEVEYAKSIGLDMCITDHHECSDALPEAICIVNPKQKDDITFKMLAGVGVAFKCITALSKEYNLEEESYLKFLDIVAVGTISDIVPLVDENRIISKYGLEMMKETKNVGLKALLNIINFKTVDSTMVSFGMAPRINACGRMGNASIAVKLLLEKDKDRANDLAIELNNQNTKRQQVEKKIFESAIKIIKEKGIDRKNSIVLYDESWHNGVIGIVASRLVNIYYKPVILLTKENGVIRGSGRCPIDFSLYDTLTKCKESLIQFGGHELAAGLSIEEEKIEEFTNKFEKVITENMHGEPKQIVAVDERITYKDLNVALLKDINTLKPYGQANKEPIFMYKGLKIQSIRTIKEDKHLKFTVRDDKYQIEALAFSQGNRRDELRLGDKIDVLCSVDINTYTQPRTIQLILQDFKKSVN